MLEGKVAVIYGAGAIGAAVARAFGDAVDAGAVRRHADRVAAEAGRIDICCRPLR